MMTALQPKAIVLGLGAISLATAAVAVMLAPALSVFIVVALGIAALALAGEPRGWAAAGLAYAGAVLVPTLLLRIDPMVGAASILWLFAVVWTTDIAAYFCGRLLGGPKLWPRVSPNKTWSGAIGGAVLGTLAGIAAARLFDIPGGARPRSCASLAASIASQGGDLYESAMKRRFGVEGFERAHPRPWRADGPARRLRRRRGARASHRPAARSGGAGRRAHAVVRPRQHKRLMRKH